MKLHQYIPAHLTVFLVAGILFGYEFQISSFYLILFSSIIIVFLCLLKIWSKTVYRPLFLFNIVAYLLCFFVGMNAIYFGSQKNKKQHYINQIKKTEKNNNIWVLELSESLKSSEKNDRFYASVTRVNNKKSKGKLLAIVPKRINAKIGEKFAVNAQPQSVKNTSNPHQFDYKKYLGKQQIYHQVFLDETNSKFLNTNKNSIQYRLTTWKTKITESLIKKGFKNDELAILKTLILGERQFVSNELRQSYANAGVIHILAISGLHIGIIWGILSFLFRPIHRFAYGKTISAVIIVLFLWMYALFSGMSPSVVRAVSMFTAVTIGSSLQRPSKTAHNLVISMFVLLLVNPYFLFSVGFQMSYLAVFSIVWLQPKIYAIWKPPYLVFDYFWKITSVSCAAQIGVLPLSLYYFHQFPGLFFISNLIVIPVLGIVLFVGFLLTFLLMLKMTPSFFVEAYRYLIFYMNEFVRWVSSKEDFLFQNIPFSFAKMIVLYGFIFFFFYWIEKKYFQRFFITLLFLIGFQLVFIFEKYTTEKHQDFTIFNTYKNNLLAIKKGTDIVFYTSDSSLHSKTINNYCISNNIEKVKFRKPKKYFNYKNHKILIVDSLGHYQYQKIKPEIVLLQNSPKIHLERLIHQLQPKLIIADASNYKSRVEQWKNTCELYKVSFYSVYEQGAFQWSKSRYE